MAISWATICGGGSARLGDPHYIPNANALYIEFEEIGLNRQLGYNSPADIVNPREMPSFEASIGSFGPVPCPPATLHDLSGLERDDGGAFRTGEGRLSVQLGNGRGKGVAALMTSQRQP